MLESNCSDRSLTVTSWSLSPCKNRNSTMMDISVWKSNQSMETKGVCILLMNEDLTCNKFANEMLQHYTYEVLHIGDALGVLNVIHKMKDRLELVLTNAYMSEPDGNLVVKYIRSHIDITIAMMDNPDKSKVVPKGQPCSFTAYVINGLRREEISKLRELALQNAKGKMVTNNPDENAQRATTSIDAIDKKDCSTFSETTWSSKIKRKAEKDESEDDESPIQKKGRVHWSPEMHKKFLEAIETIGYDRAVPKKIAEVMNIPGLTRENVASHLQKHRENIKREIALGSLPVNTANQFKLSPFLPPNSTTCLNASRNSYFMQESYNMPPLQQKPFISHALNRQFLNPHNRFSFMTTTEGNNFTNLSSLQSRPKFVPEFLSNKNFRIYSDQTKNVLVSVNRGNASNQTANYKFVGLKLTNEGNKIQFGENGTSQIQFTNYDQQNLVPEQNNHSMSTVFVSEDPSLLEDILSQCDVPPKIENQVQVPLTPLDSMALEQHVLQSLGTSGYENNKTVPDPFHNYSSKELLRDFEHETIDAPSTFVPDQDFLSPWLDILNNDTSTSIECGSEKQLSRPLEFNEFIEQEEIDRVLQDGMGNAPSEVDWNKLDNSLFDYDY